MKINNKGFTLVELLATIAVLAIISTVTIVSVTSSYQKSKEKAEETFVKQLEGYVDSYIAMYGSKLEFDPGVTYKKCYLDDIDCNENITLKKAESSNTNMNIKFISDTFSSKDVVNPNTQKECNESNTTLTIYRDEDFVYCFTIKPSGSSCISDAISTCENMYKPSGGSSCPSGSTYDNGTGYCTFK